MDFKKLKTKSVVQALTDEILEQIKNSTLKPGDALPSQRQLVEQYNVGRSSVREALQALTLAKIIEIKPGKGAVVSDLSFNSLLNPADALFDVKQKDLTDLLESRIILEIGAVELAAFRASDNDIKDLQLKLELMKKYYNEKKYDDFVNEDYEFHHIIFDSSYNIILKNIFNSVFKILVNSISMTIKVEDAGKKAISGHKKILEGIKSHNVVAASIAMQNHLKDARYDFQQVISRKEQ
jgi:GntR family transcriptional regulator, transcriptional repressor for pyruvate dehydrogenase complex